MLQATFIPKLELDQKLDQTIDLFNHHREIPYRRLRRDKDLAPRGAKSWQSFGAAGHVRNRAEG